MLGAHSIRPTNTEHRMHQSRDRERRRKKKNKMKNETPRVTGRGTANPNQCFSVLPKDRKGLS